MLNTLDAFIAAGLLITSLATVFIVAAVCGTILKRLARFLLGGG